MERSIIRNLLLLSIMLLCNPIASYSQWSTGDIRWEVESSVGSIPYMQSGANIQQIVYEIMDDIDMDWVTACHIPGMRIGPSYNTTKVIKVCGLDLHLWAGNPVAAVPDAEIPVGCEDGPWTVHIYLNTSGGWIYSSGIDAVHMRNLSLETPPYLNIDLKTVLLHEMLHALGMNSEGNAGVTLGYYHGSDRDIDGQEALHLYEKYKYCQCYTPELPIGVQWQRTVTSFDTGNPFQSSLNGQLYSNMWSPRLSPGTLATKNSGWTVSWRLNNDIPTVGANLFQQVGSARYKLKWWDLKQGGPHGTLYDTEVLINDPSDIATAVYVRSYPFTVNDGKYCDGSMAPCIFQVGNPLTHTSTPYSSEYAPDLDPIPYINVIPANSNDAFLFWIDDQGVKYYTPNMFVDATQYTNITPIFQKHLSSNHEVSDILEESGTSANNQRKIDFVNSTPGMHHQVYESCGHVFYTCSTDQGLTWTQEMNLSNLSSIDVDKPSLIADVDSVWVTWMENQELQLIKFSPNDPSNRISYDLSAIPAPNPSATPVLTRISYSSNPASSLVLLVYESGNDIVWALFADGFYCMHGPVSANWPNNTRVEPSIARHGGNSFAVVWRDNDEIYYRSGRIGTTQLPQSWVLIWSGAEEVVPFGNRPAVGPPTVSCPTSSSYGGNLVAAIACETGSASQSGVSLTFKKYGGWWHVQTFIIGNDVGRLWAPTISFIDQQALWSGFENFRIAFNYTDDFQTGSLVIKQVWAMKPEFDQYGNMTGYPIEIQGHEALHPNTVVQPPIGGNLSAFTSLLSATGNNIENVYTGLNKTRTHAWKRSRELSLTVDTSAVVIGFANMRLVSGNASSPIGWYRPVDSSVVGLDITVASEFRTESFCVLPGTRFKYIAKDLKRGMNQYPGNFQLSLEVRQLGTNNLLGTIGTFSPYAMQNGKRLAEMNINLAGYSGNTVYLQLRGFGNDSTVHLHAHDIWSLNDIDSSNFPKYVGGYEIGSSMVQSIPTVALAPNYPNPFNPTTTIVFELREASEVKLIVSDVYGRQISVLAEGVYGAGSFSKQFDASGLPTGTYYYSLHTTNGTLSRSMHLVK